MKYFILAIALLFTSSAHAKPAPGQIPIAQCWKTFAGAKRDIARIWGELPIGSAVRRDNGFGVNRFANPKTRTWTRTDTPPGGITCITDAGTDYEGPWPGKGI